MKVNMRDIKVLLIDDDIGFRSALREVLIHKGFKVIETEGVRAKQVFLSCNPDVVILDHQMPWISGIELIPVLRDINPDMPIILLSAFCDVPLAVQAIKAGTYDVIVKPPDFDELVSKIKECVANIKA